MNVEGTDGPDRWSAWGEIRRVVLPATVGALFVCGIAWAGWAGVARATCAANTEQVRKEQAATRSSLAPSLPDCRAYEQVSPVDKNGIDAAGGANRTLAAPGGKAVTYFSVAPFPAVTGSAYLPSYLSLRSLGEADWSTVGEEALVPAANKETVRGVTTDLGRSILEVGSPQTGPPCEPRVTVCATKGHSNAYVRNNTTGTFQLLAELGPSSVRFAAADAEDSRILFETAAKLVPEAGPGVGLYEWDEAKPPAERVSLVSVLPNEAATSNGAFAGPGGPATGRTPKGPKWYFYTQNSISEDGSRVFFSDAETGFIYMRELSAARTVQISAGAGPAFWRAATRDGSYVFYTEGSELYRFNVTSFEESAKPEPEALAEAREQLTAGAEGVLGVLGISEDDGSYAYFVAPGVLAGNENGSKEKAFKGAPNLYQWHDGTVTFIAPLGDEADWRGWTNEEGEHQGPAGGARTSRVTPDGRHLLLSSTGKLSGYNNDGFNELYLYDASRALGPGNPRCVTCNPAGTPATSSAYLAGAELELAYLPAVAYAFVTHNLSDDGRRVFFETSEALVPGDGNQQSDVYEWEADGEGSCESEAQDGGCLYLISTGQSTSPSSFGDASSDGSDVFFFTRQSLVSQDQDNNADLYDARIEGGIPSQNAPPPPRPCAQESACRGASASEPQEFGAPFSAIAPSSGNLPQPPPAPSPPHHVETRAEKLAKALRACRAKKAKARRKTCERVARRRYGQARRTSKKTSKGSAHR